MKFYSVINQGEKILLSIGSSWSVISVSIEIADCWKNDFVFFMIKVSFSFRKSFTAWNENESGGLVMNSSFLSILRKWKCSISKIR